MGIHLNGFFVPNKAATALARSGSGRTANITLTAHTLSVPRQKPYVKPARAAFSRKEGRVMLTARQWETARRAIEDQLEAIDDDAPIITERRIYQGEKVTFHTAPHPHTALFRVINVWKGDPNWYSNIPTWGGRVIIAKKFSDRAIDAHEVVFYYAPGHKTPIRIADRRSIAKRRDLGPSWQKALAAAFEEALEIKSVEEGV